MSFVVSKMARGMILHQGGCLEAEVQGDVAAL